MLYTETVTRSTLELLKKLEAERMMVGFNLAGGTSLSLYLGHRLSLDLDLFTPESFDAVGFAVSDQLGISLFITHLKFFYDVSVGSSGKEKGPLCVLAEIGVIMKGRELIVDRHTANSGADIMHGVVNAA